MACLGRNGYQVTPESPGDVETAPARFEFTTVWNLLNPSRVALALTFSKSTRGASVQQRGRAVRIRSSDGAQ